MLEIKRFIILLALTLPSVSGLADGLSGNICTSNRSLVGELKTVDLGPILIEFPEASPVPFIVTSPGPFLMEFERVRTILLELAPALLLPQKLRLRYWPDSSDYSGFSAVYCPGQSSQDFVALNVGGLFVSDLSTFGPTLAHELVHFLLDQAKVRMPLWQEEGLALLAQGLVSPVSVYEAARVHLVARPDIPLQLSKLELSKLNEAERISFYGHALLFLKYIEDRRGGNILSEALNEMAVGGGAKILGLGGSESDFRDMFVKFSVAKYINKISVTAPDDRSSREWLVFDPNLLSNRSVVARPKQGRLAARIGAQPGAQKIIWVRVHKLGIIEVQEGQFQGARPNTETFAISIFL